MNVWHITTIILLILQIILIISLYTAVSYFKELLVRFVDINQKNFSTHKQLMTKLSDNLEHSKKISSTVSSLKRLSNTLTKQISKTNK